MKNDHPMYGRWNNMITRCFNNNSNSFHNYGGRGITVCERWLTFENYAADVGTPPTTSHQLDRIDNDGDYSPENTKWSTVSENRRNTRQNKVITANGKTKCLQSWADELGVSDATIRKRVSRLGMSWEEAVTSPRLAKKHYGEPITQLTKDGEIVKQHASLVAAGTEMTPNNPHTGKCGVWRVVEGYRGAKTYKGFLWKYG